MSLEKVVEEILRRGEQKRAEIIREGERDRDGQILLAEKKFAEIRLKSERRNKTTIDQLKQQEASSAELESKKNMLAAERAVMEELKANALADLASYSPEEKKKLYSKLISVAKKELGSCRVYSRKEDRPLLLLNSTMSYGGEIEGIGGLVFESKDKSVRLNYRFESLLEDVWNSKIRDIHKILFG